MNDTNNDSNAKNSSYCLIFYNYEILLKENEGCLKIPLISEVKELGIDVSNVIYIGILDGKKYYATNISGKYEIKGYSFTQLAQVYEKITENQYLLILRALHIMNWVNKNSYCSLCRGKVKIEPGKGKTKCLDCGCSFYAEISPATIVAVVKEDKILLARSSKFPINMFSLLSGFVEPGESLESCVKREVREEVGIEINNIEYFGSQPWPFPGSLMIGFTAQYEAGKIMIDNEEIEKAEWFSLDDLPKIPGEMSIARNIIDWLLEERKKKKEIRT